MPSLSNHQSNNYVKLLLIGDAMSGKTGSLVSLVSAGFKLRILDLDNKLDVLKQYVMRDCPDKIGNVEFRSLRDRYKASAGGAVIDGKPKAYVDTIKMLEKWKYKDGDEEIDFGYPDEWGPDTVLVIDSFSRLCDACYDFEDTLNVAGKSGERDGRATYFNAQLAMENFLAMITSDGFECNVILIAHGTYMDLPDGTTKILPQGVGKALSPIIPQYFPNMIRYRNDRGKRTIQLKSDAMIDLANAAPFSMPDTLGIENGLAEIFAVLRAVPQAPAAERPKELKLQRKV